MIPLWPRKMAVAILSGPKLWMMGLPALFGLAWASSATAQRTPRDFISADHWAIARDGDSCAMVGNFTYQNKVSARIELRQFSPDGGFQVSVWTDEKRGLGRVTPFVRFEPDDESLFVQDSIRSELGNDRRFVTFDDTLERVAHKEARLSGEVPPPLSNEDREAREREITGYLIARVFRYDMLFRTGEMHTPMQAMRECTNSLLVDWGLNPAEQRARTRNVRPVQFQSWVSDLYEDFPTNHRIRLRVLLLVDEPGQLTSCRAQNEFDRPEYGAAACVALKEHGRFEPALDASGQPIASYQVMRMDYGVGY